MSNPPIPQYQSPTTPPPSNTMGMAGFIVSLVGVVSCGLLSPIGLILSLFGLGKQPKGFAIAGAIIGALGSVFLVVAGIGIVMGLAGLKSAAKTIGDTVTTMSTASDAHDAITASRAATGSLPSEEAGNAIVGQFSDAWQTPLRYQPSGGTFTIISAGMDKQFGTDDDLDFSPDDFMDEPATLPGVE